MLNKLFHDSVGFHNGVRVSAALNTFLLIVANLIVRTRLPPKKEGRVIPIKDFARDPPYVFSVISSVLHSWFNRDIVPSLTTVPAKRNADVFWIILPSFLPAAWLHNSWDWEQPCLLLSKYLLAVSPKILKNLVLSCPSWMLVAFLGERYQVSLHPKLECSIFFASSWREQGSSSSACWP